MGCSLFKKKNWKTLIYLIKLLICPCLLPLSHLFGPSLPICSSLEAEGWGAARSWGTRALGLTHPLFPCGLPGPGAQPALGLANTAAWAYSMVECVKPLLAGCNATVAHVPASRSTGAAQGLLGEPTSSSIWLQALEAYVNKSGGCALHKGVSKQVFFGGKMLPLWQQPGKKK